jgi:hypothetical protein
MFVNHGTPPSVVANMNERETILSWVMSKKEMKSRKDGK